LGASQLWVTLESRNTPFPTPSMLAADGSTLKINPRMQPPAPNSTLQGSQNRALKRLKRPVSLEIPMRGSLNTSLLAPPD